MVPVYASSTAGASPPRKPIDRYGLRPPRHEAIVIRDLRSGDRALLMMILERLGPQSRVQRFLAPKPVLSERDVALIADVDGADRAGVIAFAGSRGSPVGAAHYVRTDDPEVAETAIEVIDGWQRHGVGRLLVAELRVRALGAGIRHFEWSAFESNRAVAALARDLCDLRLSRVGGGVIKCSAAIADRV
jgi:GNAT superfamily N-acetyltransferase